jgi:type II secretory pathway predicted ATPase ExeA
MNRNALIQHVETWKTRLGSLSAVARKCNISPASLSTVLAGKYGADEDAMLQRIAKALDYRESHWNIVRSLHNYRTLATVFEDAKNESMWFCVSNPAGSAKTATFEDLFNRDHTGSYTFIQAEEWSARQFLVKLVEKTMGEKALEGRYKTIAQLTDMVAGYFNDMSLERPVLVIDEADKLRPAALRTLIPLFNRTEDRLGVILSGTENLEKEIRRGVRLHKKGYDELESRFGRTYITLRGASQKEVFEICNANGLFNEEAQLRIWGELEKRSKQTTVKTATGFKETMIEYAEDFRKIKRLIKRELLNLNRKERAA